jgi:uncharacterized membrane protein
LLVAILLFGGFLRFYNIGQQFYWNDEVYTSLRISGYQVSEIENELRDKQIVRVADMQKYQVAGPSKTVRDTIDGLAQEEPQLTPLYFVLARQWCRSFGDSITVTRSLAACFGLLTLPCVYWLARELFNSVNVGLSATALIAVSPAHVVFAQEARPYSLYVLMVLVSSIVLLRAMRSNAGGNWVVYAITIVLGLYTHILFGLVALSHAIYVFAVTRFAICRASICYVIASALALATFVPWLLVIINQSGPKGTSWTHTHQSLVASLTRWSGIVSRAFLDFGIAPTDSLSVKLSVMPLVALILLLIAYSIYFLIRRAPRQQWLFVVALIGSVALPLIIMDLALGRRYGTTRYILPSMIGIQLSVAYLLATMLGDSAAGSRRRRLWAAIGVVVFLGGSLSCALRSRTEMWWNKSPGKYGDYPQIARIVNQSDQPVVYCYGEWRTTQMICHCLDSDVRVQLREHPR